MLPPTSSLDTTSTRIGLGISLALAAGASLPSKAEGIVIVNDSAISTVPNATYLDLYFNPFSGTITISGVSACGSGTGWLIWEGSLYFGIYPNAGLNGLENYILGSLSGVPGGGILFTNPPPALDLESPGTGYYWSDRQTFFRLPDPGEQFYIALRTVDTITNDEWYGWVHLEIGSVNHIRTAFETNANTSIILGQIPEPTSAALLLTAGLAGVAAFRRRRKNASPAASA